MNMNGQKIAKNAGVMAVTQLSTWAMALLIAIFQPRFLGPEVIGQLSIAFSVWLIVNVLIIFGMDTHLIKLVAREPARASVLLGTSITIRTVLFVLGFALTLGYFTLMGYERPIIMIAAIIGVSFWFGAIGGAFTAVLIGMEWMGAVSLSTLVSKLVHTAVTLALLFLGFNVYYVAFVNVISSLVGTALLAFRLNRYVPIRPTFHRGDAIAMLRASAPYLVTALTLMVYQQMDKLLIGALASTEAVGWYGTAMNLVGTLMFIPVALGTVLFPTLSRSYAAGQQQLADVARRSFDLMFLLGVPIGLGVFIIARPLVLLLYGTEFTPAGDILALLGIVLIFMYVNTMLGQLLISAERTNPWNAVMVFATIITLPLDLYLIPMAQRSFGNGALGGAMSFLFTELLMTFAAIALLPRGTLSWRNLRTVAFVLCAGLTMAYVSTRALELNLVLAILGGAVTYPAMVLLLRVLPKEDLLVLKGAAARLIAKLRKTPQPAAASAEDEATQEPTVEQPTAPTTIPQPRAASDAKL